MVGKVIKTFRIINTYTIKELENKSGISAIYINQLENGKRYNPSQEILNKFAESFNVSLEFFVLLIEYGYKVNNVLNNIQDIEKKNIILFQTLSYKILEYYNKVRVEEGIISESLLNNRIISKKN